MTFCDSFRVQRERTYEYIAPRERMLSGGCPGAIGPVEVGMRLGQADCRLDPQSRDFRSAGIDRPWGYSGSALGLYPATYDRWALL